jgi:hypothetical protein
MHFAVKVIGQSTIVVKSTQVGTADVADLKLLMTWRTWCVGKSLELLFAIGFGLGGLADAEKLVLGTGDFAHGTEDFDFEEAVVYGLCEFGYAFELCRLAFGWRKRHEV